MTNNTTMLNAALKLASQGFKVFPLIPRGKKPFPGSNGFKDATQMQARVREFWTEHPDANIGLRCDGLLVLDFDGKAGIESKRELEAKYGKLCTWGVRTGGGTSEEPKEQGEQRIYRVPTDLNIRPGAGKYGYPNMDIRANDSYILALPSITRLPYETIDDSPIANAPAWVIELAMKPQRHVEVMSDGEPIPKGQRNATLTSLAGTMRRRAMPETAILAALQEVNKSQCQPPLPEYDVRKVARSIGRYGPAEPISDRDFEELFNTQPEPKQAATGHWPEPLAEEAFYGLAGKVVRAIEPHTEGDQAAILINFLVAFGSCVGCGSYAIAEADQHGCNLFAVMVGESAKSRKGSTWGQARGLLNLVDPIWTEGCISSGLSSGEGLIWATRDAIEKMKNGTTEVVDPGVDDKRLLALEPEFASLLKIMGREGNTLSPVMRQSWDRIILRILNKNSPAKSTGAHVSILGHVTREELLRYLTDTEMGNGFANRFLWLCVKRSKMLPEGGGRPDFHHLVPELKSAIDFGRTAGELKRNEAARKLWAAIYPELSTGKPGLFGSVTARAEAQVLRLSVLYAVLDVATEISLDHLKAALAVWDYCARSAKFIFGDALGDPVADHIHNTLKQNPEGLNRTDIYHLFHKHTASARIEQALGLLQITGRARSEMRKTGGRPVETWWAI